MPTQNPSYRPANKQDYHRTGGDGITDQNELLGGDYDQWQPGKISDPKAGVGTVHSKPWNQQQRAFRAEAPNTIGASPGRIASRSISEHGLTHVVLSFGSREGGGAMFAQWLKREIKTAKSLTELNSVYLDTDALAVLPEVTLEMKPLRYDKYGKPLPPEKQHGGLASLHRNWNPNYRAAIAQAKTMVFVSTLAWWSSEWCDLELRQFVEENTRRQQLGLPRLQGVSIQFPSAPDITAGYGGITRIDAHKQWEITKHLPQHIARDPRKVDIERHKLNGQLRDSWELDDTTKGQVMAAIQTWKEDTDGLDKVLASIGTFIEGGV